MTTETLFLYWPHPSKQEVDSKAAWLTIAAAGAIERGAKICSEQIGPLEPCGSARLSGCDGPPMAANKALRRSEEEAE